MTRQGLGIALLAILVAGSPSAEAVVFTLEVDDVIHPVIAEYIDGGLKQAEEEGAAAVIIQMNTPGGFDSSMREIIEKILRSEIPVLVFCRSQRRQSCIRGILYPFVRRPGRHGPRHQHRSRSSRAPGRGQVG